MEFAQCAYEAEVEGLFHRYERGLITGQAIVQTLSGQFSGVLKPVYSTAPRSQERRLAVYEMG